jgi:hypothetical protein
MVLMNKVVYLGRHVVTAPGNFHIAFLPEPNRTLSMMRPSKSNTRTS